MANKYFLYEELNGIENTKMRIINAIDTGKNVFSSLHECFNHICKKYNCYKCLTEGHEINMINEEDLLIKYYGYDSRIDYDVYMVLTKRLGKENYIEKYGTPQFIDFLIELK